MAFVEPCNTGERDANLCLVNYKKILIPCIIDVGSMKGVAGRVKIGMGKEWGKIDRSADLLDPAKNEDPELIEER